MEIQHDLKKYGIVFRLIEFGIELSEYRRYSSPHIPDIVLEALLHWPVLRLLELGGCGISKQS
jgi:hypothetical protein